MKIVLIILNFVFISCGSDSGSEGGTENNTINELVVEEIKPGEDSLERFSWHISGSSKAFSEYESSSIKSLNIKDSLYKGRGVKVLVSDDKTEAEHPDLKERGNIKDSKIMNNQTITNKNGKIEYSCNDCEYKFTYSNHEDGNHGTAVSGIIGATENNSIGSRGVAPQVQLTYFDFINANQTNKVVMAQYYGPSGDYPIHNFSWGLTNVCLENKCWADSFDPVLDNNILTYSLGTIKSFDPIVFDQSKSLNNGKGIIYVKAAGNEYEDRSDANLDSFSSNISTVVVGALNAFDGKNTLLKTNKASYSNTGTSLWISAPAGESGFNNIASFYSEKEKLIYSSPAIITTDVSNCSRGYAKDSDYVLSTFNDDPNSEDRRRFNPNCNYTSNFNGTSAATPVVTGVMALVLEANPNLNWKDLKYIIAKTAENTFLDFDEEIFSHTAFDKDTWTMNSANFKFHRKFGFGMIDANKAIELAKNYVAPLHFHKDITLVEKFVDLNDINIIESGNSRTYEVEIDENTNIQAARLGVKMNAPRAQDVKIIVESPSGTRATVLNTNTGIELVDIDFNFLINTFYQESSLGTWKITIEDRDVFNEKTYTLIEYTNGDVGVMGYSCYRVTGRNPSGNCQNVVNEVKLEIFGQ